MEENYVIGYRVEIVWVRAGVRMIIIPFILVKENNEDKNKWKKIDIKNIVMIMWLHNYIKSLHE